MKVKGIMFSGFAAAILMGSAGAYAAGTFNIASQAYVDQEVGKLSGENGAITALQGRATALENKVGNTPVATQIENAISGEVTARNTAISDAVATERTARETADTTLTNTIGGTYSTENTVASAITTLSGKVSDLEEQAGTGTVSDQIDDKIADALGDGFPANSTVKAQLDLKQNASDSNVTDLATGSHLTAGNGVAANLKALDTNLRTAEAAINTINGDENTTGSFAKAVKDAVDAEAAIARAAEQENAGDINTLEGKVSALETNMGQAGSVSDQIQAALHGANESLQPAFTEGTTVYGALNGLEGRMDTVESGVSANAAAIAALDDTYATDTALNNGLAGRIPMPTSSTCNATSGHCVLTVDTQGNLAWIDVTNPAQ